MKARGPQFKIPKINIEMTMAIVILTLALRGNRQVDLWSLLATQSNPSSRFGVKTKIPDILFELLHVHTWIHILHSHRSTLSQAQLSGWGDGSVSKVTRQQEHFSSISRNICKTACSTLGDRNGMMPGAIQPASLKSTSIVGDPISNKTSWVAPEE